MADPPKIIAEIGINHNGCLEEARFLIEASAKAQLHGIKFQYRNLENAYAAAGTEIGDEILKREIQRTYLSPADLLDLVAEARSLGLAAGISFFTKADFADFGSAIDRFDFFKVPSVELNNFELIDHITALGKPSLISTGAAEEANLQQALARLDPRLWTVLHCVSNYPVLISNARLGYLKYLKAHWAGAIGFSSHDEYWETCLLAAQLGASVIERHITRDRGADGLDHSSSSTPEEFERLSAFCQNLALIMQGDGPRLPNQGEMLNLQNLGRSYYTARPLKKGDQLQATDLVFRSPRIGLSQQEAAQVMGQPLQRDLEEGAVIDRAAVEPPADLEADALAFARERKLSLPVRFHDFEEISERLPTGHYEFHLSFRDTEKQVEFSRFSAEARYSVHLPDYINSTQLMDPFSPDPDIQAMSHLVLERTVDLTKALQDLTGAAVPVVGSFSKIHESLEVFYEQHAELLAGFRQAGVSILPQWLPPIAWYFGGAVRLHAVNGPADVDLIKRYDLPICMDVCHLAMGECVFDFVALEVIEALRPQIEHLHLADAVGFDGEGVGIGQGDEKNRATIAKALQFDCAKVVEVWQGHLNEGAGFAAALTALHRLFGRNG